MMKKEDVLKQYTTPIAAPAFVQGPHRFRRREYLNITYRTDREALEKLVPEPLEIDQPLVRFEVMKMPDTTGYGAYVECGQAAVVRLGEEQGEFLLAMYLDNLPAIAAGRELSAFPKKLGAAKLFVDSDTLVGTLDYGVLRVATATMGYKHKPLDLEKARQEVGVPTFMLKILPGYSGRPRICELVRTQITNVTVKGAWRPCPPAVLRARTGAICRFAGARDHFGQPHPDRSAPVTGNTRLRLSRRARRPAQ